jgi:hypothetical protein
MLKLILALFPLVVDVTGQSKAIKTAPYGDQQTETSAPKEASPAPSATTLPQGIPAGAVKIDENTYRFAEKSDAGKPGKVWLFRRNPFGFSKVEEKDAALNGQVVPPAETPTPVTATDLGDSYRFERKGPFGNSIWTKKKSDLTPEERSIVEKSGANGSSGAPAKPSTSRQKVAN